MTTERDKFNLKPSVVILNKDLNLKPSKIS